MVRRSVPILRRLRAHAGPIVNAGIWGGAVLASLVLYLVGAPATGARAVAVVRQHPVYVPESGRLASILVAPGQHVDAGAELGVVEVPGLAQELASAQAELMAIQAEYGMAGADLTRRFVKDTDAAHARWLAARVDLESRRAELVGLDLELSRLETPGAAIPQGDIDAARARRDAALAEIAAREEEVAALERAYLGARARGRGSDAALEARVAASAASVEALRARASSSVLRAQAAGTVTGAVPSAGTWLQAGIPAMTLTEATAQEAVVYVSPSLARDLEQGAVASLVDLRGERYAARIATIGPAVEGVPRQQAADAERAEWGIPVRLTVADAVLTPGEALTVEF
jgi:multidrug efflux pump subunit AcrA (membrane-fusion protein)